jgi:hypothetical protein
VFQQWREWRATRAPGFARGDRTAYYAHRNFAAHFLEFVRLHYLPNASKAPVAINALVEYEQAMLGQADMIISGEAQDVDDRGALLSAESRPQLLPGVNVIQLPADYGEIVRRLRDKRSLDSIPAQPVNLVISRFAAGPALVWQLTPLSAELLSLCEGGLTVKEIAAEFKERQLGIPGVPAAESCLAGIEILRQQRLIALS